MNEELPPEPRKPEEYECCGRHCDPCIMDYYQRAMERWEKKVAEIKAQNKGE